jgi:hypothetical protein
MVVVVGGHSRNIGKTSVVAGLIRRSPQWNWTAMKITQFGHGVCSASGSACGCSLAPDHPYAIAREREPGHTDTGRFLAAGARQSYWVRTAAGQLAHAHAAIGDVLAASQNMIIESNSIMEFLSPDLYLVVLDFSQPDFKSSALRFLERADAVISIQREIREPLWKGVARHLWETKPRFPVRPPEYVSQPLVDFVNCALASSLPTIV